MPFCHRLLCGFLTRQGVRTSEAVGLRCGDIAWTDDGAAAVTLDENKIDAPRAWTLTAGVAEGCARGANPESRKPAAPTSTCSATSTAADEPGPTRAKRVSEPGVKIDRKQLFEASPAGARSAPMTCAPRSSR